MVKEVGLANATILGFRRSLTDDTALRAQVSTTHRDGPQTYRSTISISAPFLSELLRLDGAMLTSNDVVECIDLRVGYASSGTESSQGWEALDDSIGKFVASNVLHTIA